MKTWQVLRKNKKLWSKYFIRENVVRYIRDFFLKEQFHEVDTPILLPSVIPESYLEVFETNLLDRNRKKRRMFLSTSPETALKKLLVAGIGNCYSLTKSFRNTETAGNLHNPEFTILEWYRIPSSYTEIMKDCENLINFIQKSLKLSKRFSYQGKPIDLTPPWERISVAKALKKYTNIDFDDITQNGFTSDEIIKIARNKGYQVSANNNWEEVFNQIFLNEVEPHLGTHGKPTIIYDYPRPLAAIAKIKEDDARFAERFEFYIAGLELGDCYNESTDIKYLKGKFKEELKALKKKKKTMVIMDEDFLEAMKYPLPPYAGVAVGVDRLVMLFTNSKSISETLLFVV